MNRFSLRAVIVTTAVAVTVVSVPSPAAAVVPPETVHSEVVQMGTSTLTASFTDWPLRADRSLDFTFEPVGGIAGRTGVLRTTAPNGQPVPLGISARLARRAEARLVRHPRDPNVWGLDAVALSEEGMWRFEFTVQGGPEGTQTGVLELNAGPRPGPSSTLTWTLGLMPWFIVAVLLTWLWIRSRPTRRRLSSDWSG